MARIVPSDLTPAYLEQANKDEIDTLIELRDRLPDAYTVFHGVHWSKTQPYGTSFGEADFIVVNLAGDVLLIEQKMGTLRETDEGLVKNYGDGEKNVAGQINRSVSAIKNKYRRQFRTTLAVDYLFYCPDHAVKALNAAGLDPGRIVDARARDSLSERIESILGSGEGSDSGDAERILEFFRQTFELVPDIHAHRRGQEKSYRRQAGVFATLLGNLEMDPFRLRVSATAGSGKSLLAGRFFNDHVSQGRRPLLACFNHLLAESFRNNLDGGYVKTFHGLCREFVVDQGYDVDVSRASEDPAFWKTLLDAVVAREVPEGWRFDALVVDEGQDFDQDWVDILLCFLAEGGSILWLEDPQQNLYGKQPVQVPCSVTYRSQTNYRTPHHIASFIQDVLPFEFEAGNPIPGFGVQVHPYETEEELLKLADKLVIERMRDRFAQEDVAVVTMRGLKSTAFRDSARIGNVPLRRFTERYDADHRQVMTDGRLRFDTIFRFKGHEAPSVILVEVDPDKDQLDQWRRRLYCGMTRATVRLDVLVKASNPENNALSKQSN